MARRQIDRQLVHHRFQGVVCRNSRQGGIVCGGDAAVHRRRRGMVGQLEVDRSGGALAVDFDLQSIQSALVGFGSQTLGQARVHGHQAGSVGQDGALCCGEVRRQSVRG